MSSVLSVQYRWVQFITEQLSSQQPSTWSSETIFANRNSARSQEKADSISSLGEEFGPEQPSVGGSFCRQLGSGWMTKVAKHKFGSKPLSSTPLWSMLQILLPSSYPSFLTVMGCFISEREKWILFFPRVLLVMMSSTAIVPLTNIRLKTLLKNQKISHVSIFLTLMHLS